MAKNTLTVGDVTLLSFSDCVSDDIDVGKFFPDEPKEAWAAYPDHVTPDLKARPVNIACFLVVSPRHRVMVDTGIGPVPHEAFPGLKGTMLGKMRRAGFRPEDIDIVFSTHVHLDHMGWNTVLRGNRLTRTFPKAKYLAPKADWDALFDPQEAIYARRPDDISKEGVEILSWSKPLAERMQAFGNVELTVGGQNITDEIKVLDTPGHTPGHQSLMIGSKGERLFLLGDVVHLPVQLEVPERIVGADVHPRLGRKTRVDTVKWLEREGLMVAAVHFPAPGFGRVVRGQGRRYWQPL